MERQCEFCLRMVVRTTQHHLIPRTCHSNKWFKKRFTREQMQMTVSLCRECHLAVHRFIPSEKTLGRNYNSLESLASHPELAKFRQWIARQKN
ncbi:MAG: hypothetical protein KDA87_02935 [Planctomycetales bacterium]|nr:hypothetical protein [Planctomycetales bacterium]